MPSRSFDVQGHGNEMEDEVDAWPPFRQAGVFDPFMDDSRAAVQTIRLIDHTVAVGGAAGQVNCLFMCSPLYFSLRLTRNLNPSNSNPHVHTLLVCFFLSPPSTWLHVPRLYALVSSSFPTHKFNWGIWTYPLSSPNVVRQNPGFHYTGTSSDVNLLWDFAFALHVSVHYTRVMIQRFIFISHPVVPYSFGSNILDYESTKQCVGLFRQVVSFRISCMMWFCDSSVTPFWERCPGESGRIGLFACSLMSVRFATQTTTHKFVFLRLDWRCNATSPNSWFRPNHFQYARGIFSYTQINLCLSVHIHTPYCLQITLHLWCDKHSYSQYKRWYCL